MKTRQLSRLLFPLAFFVLLLCLPVFTGNATLSALLFFVKTVFPSLFVSLCLSSMLTASPAVGLLYRFPLGVELTVWVLGVLCGFPVGARCALQLYEAGTISKTRAEFLCGFSNLASAPFLTGVVGSSLFAEPSFGASLMALQAVCSVLAALSLFWIYRPGCGGVSQKTPPASKPFASHIAGSAHAMLELGGMLIFFGVAVETVGYCLGNHGSLTVLLSGLMEFSAGCREASRIGGMVGKWMAVLFVGCGGVCVLGQISAVTKGKLSLRPYLLGKLLQTAWMAVLFPLFP